MDALSTATIGIFLGVFLRTMLPYLKKLKEAQAAKLQFFFDPHFVYTAVLSGIVSFVVTMFLLPSFNQLDGAPLIVFSSGFTGGFTANSLINEIIS